MPNRWFGLRRLLAAGSKYAQELLKEIEQPPSR
jgi:hypothetical protein